MNLDRKIELFIDTNVWDYFYDNKYDLNVEFPVCEFNLYITPEIRKEINLIPQGNKRDYIEKAIREREVKIHFFFGFTSYADNDSDYDKISGFSTYQEIEDKDNCGNILDYKEANIYKSEEYNIGPKVRPTGLFNNETDIFLAVRSLYSFVLTLDSSGPLARVKDLFKNCTVINLGEYKNDMPISQFVKSYLK